MDENSSNTAEVEQRIRMLIDVLSFTTRVYSRRTDCQCRENRKYCTGAFRRICPIRGARIRDPVMPSTHMPFLIGCSEKYQKSLHSLRASCRGV